MQKKNSRNGLVLFTNCLLVLMAVTLMGTELQAQMKQPKEVTLSGTLIDLTCASKGKAMMDSWKNTEDDHMMPDGNLQKQCATMCLQGGQPAALFSKGQIAAVFACNARGTLAGFAAKSVEVGGFWAGDGKEVKTFVPMKIRSGSGSWQDVNCATMH